MDEKKRISLHIAGRMLTIVTDEPEDFVRAIEKELDQRIAALCRSNPRMAGRESKIDAVILCAVDSMSREMRDAGEADALRDRIAAGEKKYRELLEEYDLLSARLDAMESTRDRRQDLTKEDKIDRIGTLLRAQKQGAGNT